MAKTFYSKVTGKLESMVQKGACNRCKKKGTIYLTIMGDMKCSSCCAKFGKNHIAKD